MDFETNSIDEENTQMGFGDAHFGLADIMASAGETQSGSGSSISSASPPSHDWHSTGPSSWMDTNSASGPESSMDPFLVDGLNGSGTGFDIPQFDLSSLNDVANMHMGNITLEMYNNFGFLPPQEMHKSHASVFPTQQQQQHTVVPNTIVPNSLINNMVIAQPSEEQDIIAAVKRITGITNAQVAGAPSLFHEQYTTIPQRFSDHSYSSASSDRSSVPPQTIEPHQSTLPSTPSSAPPQSPSDVHATSPIVVQQSTHIIAGPTSRPKTAHTTIERRYRTNLNTCITGLREAIPAVRYLDKNYVPASGIRDTVDEHGCVDGVKAARKISKATIMSKAREYIVVLRRREDRTKDELNALKTLVSSLVGGPKLLEEWQRLYAIQQASVATDDDLGADDEDDLDGDEDEEDEDERPRKKSKASASAAPTTTNGKVKKEKSIIIKGVVVTPTTPVDERPKKRGRPPKNPGSTSVSSSRLQTSSGQVQFAPMSHTVNPSSVPIIAQPTGGQQYSFVSGLPIPQQQQKPALFLASFVFLSFFKPAVRRTVILASEEGGNHSHVGQVLSGGLGKVIKEESWWSHEVVHVLHTAIMLALFAGLVVSLAPQRLRNRAWRWASRWLAPEGVAVAPMVEEVQLEDVSVPLKERAERELKSSASTPKSKLKVFNAFQSSSADKTAEDLGLMALLRFSTKASQALELWKEGSVNEEVARSIAPAFEIPLPQAVELVSTSASDKRSPLVIVASKAVEQRLERTLKDAFVDEVFALCDDAESSQPSEVLSQHSREELVTISRAVGGKPAEVVKHFDAALSGSYTSSTDTDSLFNLLKVLSLMRRIFPTSRLSTSGLPSPPPSPLLQEDLVKMERVLRVALGGVKGVEVEKAKDLLISRLSARAKTRRAEDLDRD